MVGLPEKIHLGYTYTKQLFVIYLKFKFNQMSSILFAKFGTLKCGLSRHCSHRLGLWLKR